ncbi:MAG: isochorismatase family protein [Solirubrobacterales bacterium]|nr:isochorismatase family protein [Solirubrobacterales bacterium]
MRAQQPAGGKLDPERAALVLIDVQEAFRKALPSFDEVARACAVLADGAAQIGVPIVVTEQYPKGLGGTVAEVAERLPADLEPVDKVRFSATEAQGFDLAGRDQALVCGIETHVCVNQTVLDLLADGIEAHVAADAVGSRTEANRELGLAKMERAGAVVTSVETALFELLRGSDAPAFKRVQALVIEYAPNAS